MAKNQSKYPQGGSVDSLTAGVEPVYGTSITGDSPVARIGPGSVVVNSRPTHKARGN